MGSPALLLFLHLPAVGVVAHQFLQDQPGTADQPLQPTGGVAVDQLPERGSGRRPSTVVHQQCDRLRHLNRSGDAHYLHGGVCLLSGEVSSTADAAQPDHRRCAGADYRPHGALLSPHQRADLYDSLWALIFTYTAINIPISTFLMYGFMRSIPAELEEAAVIDGASLLPAIHVGDLSPEPYRLGHGGNVCLSLFVERVHLRAPVDLQRAVPGRCSWGFASLPASSSPTTPRCLPPSS